VKGQIPQGLLISLDPEGEDIRLLDRWTHLTFHWDRPRASFALPDGDEIERRLQAIEIMLKERLQEPLNTVDYRTLRKIATRAEALRSQLQQSDEHAMAIASSEDRLSSPDYANLTTAVSLSDELYSALAKTGLGNAIGSFGSDLATLPTQYALPNLDGTFNKDVVRDLPAGGSQPVWTMGRQKVLRDAASDKLTRMSGSANAPLESVEAHQTAKHRLFSASSFPSKTKFAGASLRIAVGTGLTVGNLALGVSAGLADTLFSVGATALPVYVGLATSAYTGLVQIADGLEKIAGLGKV